MDIPFASFKLCPCILLGFSHICISTLSCSISFRFLQMYLHIIMPLAINTFVSRCWCILRWCAIIELFFQSYFYVGGRNSCGRMICGRFSLYLLHSWLYLLWHEGLWSCLHLESTSRCIPRWCIVTFFSFNSAFM